MAEVYEIIDDLLAKKGITTYKLAADLGLSRSFMTELRKGRSKSLKLDTAQKIADYFEVSIDYLSSGENEKTSPEAGEVKSIDDEVSKILSGLMENEDLMLDGEIVTEEAAVYFRESLLAVYEHAKKLNAERKEKE